MTRSMNGCLYSDHFYFFLCHLQNLVDNFKWSWKNGDRSSVVATRGPTLLIFSIARLLAMAVFVVVCQSRPITRGAFNLFHNILKSDPSMSTRKGWFTFFSHLRCTKTVKFNMPDKPQQVVLWSRSVPVYIFFLFLLHESEQVLGEEKRTLWLIRKGRGC